MKAVLSIGNPLKSDDNIGNVVLDMLKSDVKKFRGETTPENFIGKLEGFEKIIIVDAIEFEGNAGDVKLFDLEDVLDRLTSTHSMPISMIKKFYPNSKLSVIGIKPNNMDVGDRLSEKLESKKNEIVENVERIISSL